MSFPRPSSDASHDKLFGAPNTTRRRPDASHDKLFGAPNTTRRRPDASHDKLFGAPNPPRRRPDASHDKLFGAPDRACHRQMLRTGPNPATRTLGPHPRRVERFVMPMTLRTLRA